MPSNSNSRSVGRVPNGVLKMHQTIAVQLDTHYGTWIYLRPPTKFNTPAQPLIHLSQWHLAKIIFKGKWFIPWWFEMGVTCILYMAWITYSFLKIHHIYGLCLVKVNSDQIKDWNYYDSLKWMIVQPVRYWIKWCNSCLSYLLVFYDAVIGTPHFIGFALLSGKVHRTCDYQEITTMESPVSMLKKKTNASQITHHMLPLHTSYNCQLFYLQRIYLIS